MRNVEIKARLRDMGAAERIAVELAGPEPHARLRQVDTYFRVPAGRLKLREISGTEERAELIVYHRPDQSGPKSSTYHVAPVDDPAALKGVLVECLGVRIVVDKRRTVYLWRNVRIHLDSVAGLGEFLEFEAVMPEGAADEEGERLVADLMERFGTPRGDLIEGSYSDMAEGQAS